MEYKYKLSLCVCIKNEAHNINHFIGHYITQGVEHFYIINNNSDDNLEEIIQESPYNLLITLLHFETPIDVNQAYSYTNGLVAAYNKTCAKLIKEETEWAIVVDIDEFMYGKNGYNIRTYLDQIDPEIGSIYVLWNIMTSPLVSTESCSPFSTNINTFRRLNYDLINNVSAEIRNANDFGKSIFRTSMLNGPVALHKLHKTTGKIINNYGENKNSWYDNKNAIVLSEEQFKKINISLNHYVIRDYNEYIKKKIHYENNPTNRKLFLAGVLELLGLHDKYFAPNC